MCKYIYEKGKLKNTNCIYPDFYKTNFPNTKLPIDNQGYCIYHSNDVAWKKENNFFQYFIILLENLNKRVAISDLKKKIPLFDFSGFVFVGSENKVDFSNLTFEKNARFYNAVFLEDLIIFNTNFKGGCQFNNVSFQKKVSIQESKFLDVSAFEESIFFDSFFCKNSYFKAFTLFSSSIFKNNFSVKFTKFDNIVLFDNIKFNLNNSRAFSIFDDVTFAEYSTVDFDNSVFDGLARFRDVKFNANVSFVNTQFNLVDNSNLMESAVTFKNISINNNASILFKSDNAYTKMFKKDVSFTFNQEINGSISFSNIDLESLSPRTAMSFPLLKEKGKINIEQGCYKNLNINIFIASQSILNKERILIEKSILSRNNTFKDKNILLKPIRWENRDKGNSGKRKQDEYNSLILSSEVFILLLWNSVGQYSKEEFISAFEGLQKGKYPEKIYIFNKTDNTSFDNANSEKDFSSFLAELKKELLIIDFASDTELLTEMDYLFEDLIKKYKNDIRTKR